MFCKIKKFGACDKGAVAVLSALLMLVFVGLGALAVDLGSFFFQKRRLQSATDLAAIAAAANFANPRQAAIATLALNGFPASALQTLQTGSYVADPRIQPGLRFTPGVTGALNAVHITTQTTAPYIFGAIFLPRSARADAACSPSGAQNCLTTSGGDSARVKIAAQSTAAQNALASFAIGSRLLSLNGGLLNSLLGSLLGSQLSLSVMDYQALVNANIDLFTFSNALATRAHLTAITYDQLITGSFNAGLVFNAIADAARANPNFNPLATTPLSELAAAAPNTNVNLASVLSFGPFGAMSVGSNGPISATISAFDLINAVAQIANGAHQIEIALNLNAPPIASASLQLAIGERPVGTAFVAIGQTGASVHTAQTRLLLTAQVGISGQTSLVNVPIYVELASATAQLSSLQCSGGDPTTSVVTLAVTPAVVDAWIGNVSSADFTNFTGAPSPGPATLLNVENLATVTGRAHATITNLSATPVSFSYSEILKATKKTTSTTDYLASLLSNLVGGLQMKVTVAGLGLGLPSNLTQTVGQALALAVSPLDQTLSGILQTLGVGLGQADSWVSGVRCGGAVLVN